MSDKFNFKWLLAAGLAAIITTGCQSSPPTGASTPNNSNDNTASSSTTSSGDAETSSQAQSDATQVSDKTSRLNLTDAQKTQITQIREQTQTKILALLTPEQQEKYKAATQGEGTYSGKALRSLNLSPDQKQQVREIMREQRQQTQAVLTPEQQAQFKQHRRDREQNSSN